MRDGVPSYFAKRTRPNPTDDEDVTMGDIVNLRRELRKRAQRKFDKTYGAKPSDRKS